jgi:hypothetical protein
MARKTLVNVELEGLRKFIQKFNLSAQQVLPEMGGAIYEEASVIADEADMLVPYDTGALALSQIVHSPAYQGNRVYVDITYGGPSARYAEVQHENMEFNHPSLASGLPPNGRQAKYLEDPLMESVDGGRLSQVLAWRIEARLLRKMGY